MIQQELPTRQRLIRLIRESGGSTLADLRRRTGLSRSTLRQHLGRMARDGVVQSYLVRRPSGRPPLMYRLTPQAELASPETYLTFLRAVFDALRSQGQERVDALFREIAERVAAQHPEIRALPDMSARLDAVRRLFFSDAEATQVERTDGGYQFSLYTCPLAPVAMEFRDLCCVTREVIRGLVGEEVEQSEWIIRGDPRCTFEVRGGGNGNGGGNGKTRAAVATVERVVKSRLSPAVEIAAEPITFAFAGSRSDPVLAQMAQGLREVFGSHGHRFAQSEDDDLRLVFNFIDAARPRPFRRKGKGTFLVTVAVTDRRPDNILKEGYPLLIRSLGNLMIYLVRSGGHVETHFVTLEQGTYQSPDLTGDAYFAYLYERLLPLACSELVIDNEFHTDLPPELWEGDELTAQLAEAGRRLDALDLLPTPFPMHELLPARDMRHIQRLFGLGGLSYGNLSVRKDATRYWMSASGVDKGHMAEIGRDMLLVKGFDPQRKVMLLSVPPHVKPRRVSVDAIEHWMIYTEHPEVGAIVHVHAWMQGVPSTAINYPCGTIQLAQAVAEKVRETPDAVHAVVGLKNHGLTITGHTLADIFDRLEEGFIRQVPMS
ncbi:MAG: class II aldolase/adducin family protein [Armatimonadetes bacterium CSP1-3]|nr:MAG: class II aldolase/adducin family protein [Armatimonadetes bacterium CSP1-3]